MTFEEHEAATIAAMRARTAPPPSGGNGGPDDGQIAQAARRGYTSYWLRALECGATPLPFGEWLETLAGDAAGTATE